jgi:release factor glutamine methyltransferase
MSIAEVYDKGRVTFMGIDLFVAPGALVPREETELLGRTALDAVRDMDVAAPRIIDMCCGAGNLACGIALELPRARIWACDLTAPCVDIAQRNVLQHELGDRVSVHRGDLFAAVQDLGLEHSIDAIVCNPPYISDKRLAADRAELLSHEPREAFDGGPYGLSVHQRVVRAAPEYLRPGGVLLFEIGVGQVRQVQILFERARIYENICAVSDGSGEARVVHARLKPVKAA